MPMTRLKPQTLDVLFKHPEDFAQRLRHAMTHAEICLRNGRAGDRYAMLDSDAAWFSEAPTPGDWLDLLWASTESSADNSLNPQRLSLLNILNRVIGSLSQGPDDPQRFTALTVCRFVRHQHAIDLIPALRARAFGPAPWLNDSELRAALLLAVYANVTSVESFEFLDQFASDTPRLKRDLDYAQYSVFCAEFITSAAARLNKVSGGKVDDPLLQRLTHLEDCAWTYIERPSSPVPRPEDFGALVCEAIDEATAMELPQPFRDAITDLKNLLADAKKFSGVQDEVNVFLKRVSKQARDGQHLPRAKLSSP